MVGGATVPRPAIRTLPARCGPESLSDALMPSRPRSEVCDLLFPVLGTPARRRAN